ncbi:MAG: MBL fold metallo-hydrolase [Actinobacteria bacterium]|nr:MBL fold metallo-hydrolase [Actinomycetota bacterium]
MDWFSRTAIDDDITLLVEPYVHELLRCNIWHVRGRERDLLVDTGVGVAVLSEAATDLFDASILAVATHAHMDHSGGMHEFEQRAIHSAEVAALATAQENMRLDVGSYDEATLVAIAHMGYDISGGLLTEIPHAGFDPATHELQATTATMVLDEGDVIDLGDRAFEVLHLPGHSPGSIGLYDAKSRLLFSGDAVYDGPLLDELDGSDVEHYVATMMRLMALDVEVVHGGHGSSMGPKRFREIVQQYLDLRGAA